MKYDHAQRKQKLRQSLRCSQQEAFAAATMTGTGDNFLNAFAIHLQASALQMGWLTAIPQLFGALAQVFSVWLGNWFRRKPLVVSVAAIQACIVAAMAVLAFFDGRNRLGAAGVGWLILLAVGYFICLNLIQPHWRAWMGALVPSRRRGKFFATRTRLTMIASLLVFVFGGVALTVTDRAGLVWFGFALLFLIAAVGRLLSAQLLARMHDPLQEPALSTGELLLSWQHVRESLRDPQFRHYSFFVAALQGSVAVSAPFFAVYMLAELQFTYLQYSLNSIASIATQFFMLRHWGHFADRFGNHLVMVFCSCLISIIPLLWLLSPNFYYLVLVQMVSGVCWSGFTLCAINYLYDIRPHQTNFALYAAIQSATTALAVCGGGLLGGYVARHVGDIAMVLAVFWQPERLLVIVFVVSSILRLAVVAGFLPLLEEPRIRRRPHLLEVVVRVVRFNAISGIALDWMSVARKSRTGSDDKVDSES
jgi:MFS family permease